MMAARLEDLCLARVAAIGLQDAFARSKKDITPVMIKPELRALMVRKLFARRLGAPELPPEFFVGTFTSLSLCGCELGTDVLSMIGRQCQDLVTLDLTSCPRATDAGVRAVVAGCTQLVELKLRGCRQVGDLSVQTIATSLICLQSIDIGGCYNVSEEPIHNLVTWHGSRLTKLGVSGCAFSNKTVALISDHCSKLQTLQLGYAAEPLSAKAMGSLTQQCVHLQTLALHWSHTDDALLGLLGKNVTSLTDLDLTGCEGVSEIGASAIVRMCPLLRRIVLSKCPQITPEVVEIIKEGDDLQIVYT